MIPARPVSNLIVDASSEPVTLEEAKLFLRVDHDDDDDLIEELITSARQWIESYTRRSLPEKTFDIAFPRFFDVRSPLYIPHAPLTDASKVTSVKYYDGDGDLQTLGTEHYRVIASTGAFAGRGYIEITQDADLPLLDPTVENPVIVRAVCGYGASVPKGLKSALLLHLSDIYEQRQDANNVTVERLCSPYRLIEVA